MIEDVGSLCPLTTASISRPPPRFSNEWFWLTGLISFLIFTTLLLFRRALLFFTSWLVCRHRLPLSDPGVCRFPPCSPIHLGDFLMFLAHHTEQAGVSRFNLKHGLTFSSHLASAISQKYLLRLDRRRCKASCSQISTHIVSA